ncbi:hypothetical protein ADM96_32670 [Burkholderia sp. ST111]|nr:hypothetical protein ADM96_32670 [Burkholderia sp. ST111]
MVLWAGELMFGVCRVRHPLGSIPAAACAGVTIVSLLMLPIVWFGGVTAATAFGIVAICICVLRLLLRERIAVMKDTHAYLDVLATCSLALLVYWSCQSIASALPDLGRSGALHAWSDYYIHGVQIAEFGDPLAVGRGNVMMVDGPRNFYHYGVFMLPSALLSISGLPGLGIATAVLLPMGLLVGWLGLYVLCAELGGRMLGLVSALIVVFLPDPSGYGLRNGFFGFRWLMFTAPGSAYAIGVGAIGLVFILHGMRGILQKRSWAVGFGLIASLILIRAHMFLIEAPAALGAVLIHKLARRAGRRTITAGSLCLVLLLIVSVTTGGREIWTHEVSALFRFLDSVFRDMEPTAHAALGQSLVTQYGRLIATPIELLLVLLMSLGVFSVIFPAVCVIAWRRGSLAPEHLLLGLLVATFVLLVAFAPQAGNGDVSEYKQRHFVFLYSVIGASSIALFIREGLPNLWHFSKKSKVLSMLFCLFLALVIALFVRPVDAGRPVFAWGHAFYDTPIDACMTQAASYIRPRARIGDVVAFGGNDAGTTLVDPATMLVSLVDVPAFLGRYAMQMARRSNDGAPKNCSDE